MFKTVPALDKEVWLYSKTDFVSLADFALDFDFGNCYQVTGVEDLWSVLKDFLLTARDIFVPLLSVSKGLQCPRWMSSVIRHLINKSRTLQRRTFPQASV